MPVLEHHGHTHNQDDINTHDPKGGSEDQVQIAVCERRELGDAAALLCCDQGIKADIVDLERRSGRIKVTAAIELGWVSTLLS